MSILKLKDSQGNWISVPTIKGEDGKSISSATLNGDYTLTLAFSDGTSYTTPSIRGEKGAKGDKGDTGDPATSMQIHICSSGEYDSETKRPTISTPDDKTFYLVPNSSGTSSDLFIEWVYVNNAWEMFGSASIDLSGYLTDVTVDGTSVVTNGVAEIPIAGVNSLGLMKVGSGLIVSSSGIVKTFPSDDNLNKIGTNNERTITPFTQHSSTFYGLAKAAGHDEKNSTLPVGQYTDEAKTAIQDMLGIDFHYLTPEMYGAIGDGTTDDSVALQNCINDAITYELPVRGYNKYATTQPINIVAKYLNLYIHEIIYSGNDVAVILTGRYNNINIDTIDAYDSTGCGFRLTTTPEREAIYNEIHIGYIASYGNGIEYLNLNGEQGLYYNRLYINQLYSRQANCIYINANNRQCGENSFWGKHITNNNGYFIYCEDSGNNPSNKFYEFCIESSSKNGVYGQATLINCRTVECMDRKKPDNDEGNIFTFNGVLPMGKAINTNIDYLCVDVSNASSYEDRLELIKTRLENGASKASAYDAGFPQEMSYIIGEGIRLWDYYSVTDSTLGNNSPTGKVIAYYNHKGFVPDYDWYHKIEVSEYYTITTDHVVPTIFDINTNTTIHLDDSYCPVGIKKFKVIQYDDKKAVIYDHNNNLIFNGQKYGAGTYEIECHMTDHTFDVIANSETFTYGEKATRGKYFGINEEWDVENVIDNLDKHLNSKATAIIESADGSIVTFEDGADNIDLKKMVVDIDPIQDLNGYDSPWVGGGGKNLLKNTLTSRTVNGLTITVDELGRITINGTATANTNLSINGDIDIGAGTYVISGITGGSTSTYKLEAKADGAWGNNVTTQPLTVTVTEGLTNLALVIYSDATLTNVVISPMICDASASNPTVFEPYENICPISGWTGVDVEQSGKNLFDVSTIYHGSYAISPPKYPLNAQNEVYRTVIIDYLPSGTYTFSTSLSNCVILRYLNGATNVGVSSSQASITITMVKSGKFMLCFRKSDSSVITEEFTVQVEQGSSAISYEPYQGQSIPINWQTEAGIVYGGKLDVLSGKLRVEQVTAIYDGTETYTNTYFPTVVCTKVLPIGTGDGSTFLCSHFPSGTYYAKFSTSAKKAIQFNHCDVVWGVSSADELKAKFAQQYANGTPVTICYPLAEPIEVQLTPHIIKSLLGHNTIYANTGNTSVEYCADTELYIEKVKPSVNVDDVQINNTSIVNDGIANIPLATATTAGLVKADVHANGYRGGIATIDNKLFVVGSALEGIKYGGDYSKPVVAGNQHQSTFYGLAKAAGADEKDSTLAFGTYSDNAKSSIQNMLGITDKYSPKEWIAESETELVTNAHNVGDLFYIGETLYKVIADLNAGDAINVGVNVEEVNANDILDDYATKEDVQDNVSIVEKSASGTVASFDDGMDDMPLKSLMVDINPVQDLHGYDAPWVAGGGKNLFEPLSGTRLEITFTPNTDGTVSINGTRTSGDAVWVNLSKRVTLPYNGINAGDTIVLYSNVYVGVAAYDSQGTRISNQTGGTSTPTYTIPDNAIELVMYQYAKSSPVEVGEVINITDAKFYIAKENSFSSWTPYENICPITGWTGMNIQRDGKNLFYPPQIEERTYRGITVSVSGDTYTVTGTASGGAETRNLLDNSRANFYTSIRLRDNIWVEAGTYTFTAFRSKANGSVGMVYGTDLDETYTSANNHYIALNSPATLTFSEKTYITPYVSFSNGVASDYTLTIQIESGTASTEYEPYNGTTIPISWASEAGTVYGGSLDVLSGKLTVNLRSIVVDSTKITRDSGTRYHVAKSYIGDFKSTGFARMNKFRPRTASEGWNAGGMFFLDSNNLQMNAYRAFDTRAEFIEEYGELQLCYTLATPIEIQLTPHEVNSLLGVNNIFADTGNTSVEYFSQVDKDLIDYIETSLKPYAKEEKLNDYVDDVQINGTSIVTDGVANVPIASPTSLGLMKVGSGLMVSSSGIVKILPSDNDLNKIGTDINRPITPSTQHSSTFYGLTKAAGVDMSSSSNVVGIYTDEAKTAIKQMLGVHDTYDSFVEEITGTDVTITGQPSYRYNCGEVLSLSITPPESGTIDIRFTSGSTPTVLTLPSTVKMPEWWVEVEANTIYEMCITDGIYCGVMTWAM